MPSSLLTRGAGVSAISPLTFRRGQFGRAFCTGWADILYTARWKRNHRTLHSEPLRVPSPTRLGFRIHLSSVSRVRRVGLLRAGGTMNITGGDLYRAAVTGGPTQNSDRNIAGTDWASDGRMALVRVIPERSKSSFLWVLPSTARRGGSVMCASRRRETHWRLSIIRPARRCRRSLLAELGGSRRVISSGWLSARRLAWHPRTGESGSRERRDGAPAPVGRNAGRTLRSVSQVPGNLTLRYRQAMAAFYSRWSPAGWKCRKARQRRHRAELFFNRLVACATALARR